PAPAGQRPTPAATAGGAARAPGRRGVGEGRPRGPPRRPATKTREDARRSLEQLPDLRPRPRVQHLLLRQPSAASLRDSHLDVLERTQLMRVRVDGDLYASLAGEPGMRVAQIEAVRLRVDLEERPRFDRLRDDTLDVQVGG